jgi:hypothetical protein
MTLINKYLDIIKKPFKDKGFYYDVDTAEKCEKVADEFAIGFAEWYFNLWYTDDDLSFDNNSRQELLEIYKKEKGL